MKKNKEFSSSKMIKTPLIHSQTSKLIQPRPLSRVQSPKNNIGDFKSYREQNIKSISKDNQKLKQNLQIGQINTISSLEKSQQQKIVKNTIIDRVKTQENQIKQPISQLIQNRISKKIISQLNIKTEQDQVNLPINMILKKQQSVIDKQLKENRSNSKFKSNKTQIIDPYLAQILSQNKKQIVLPSTSQNQFKIQEVSQFPSSIPQNYVAIILQQQNNKALNLLVSINKITAKQFCDELLKKFEGAIGFTTSSIAVDFYLTQEFSAEVLNKQTLNLTPIYPPFQSQDICLKNFQLLKCIGVGGFSRVYLVQNLINGQFYAMKLIDKNFIINNKKENIILNERNLMGQLDHQFVVQMNFAFESKYWIVFVMEFCAGGELFYLLKQIRRMNEAQAIFYFAEMCLAMKYIHSKDIVYRDVKPENILIGLDGHIKIADFGLSKILKNSDPLAQSFCGSPEYMAPEMLTREGHNQQVDHYCLGALLYELITGLPPFYCNDTDEIFKDILEKKIKFPEDLKLSNELKDLLLGLLTKDPNKRLGSKNGIDEIISHEWFRNLNFKDLLNKRIEPPFKPNPIEFNFDVEEFEKGDNSFRREYQNLQNKAKENDTGNLIKNFRFENKNIKDKQEINNKEMIRQVFTPSNQKRRIERGLSTQNLKELRDKKGNYL